MCAGFILIVENICVTVDTSNHWVYELLVWQLKYSNKELTCGRNIVKKLTDIEGYLAAAKNKNIEDNK